MRTEYRCSFFIDENLKLVKQLILQFQRDFFIMINALYTSRS